LLPELAVSGYPPEDLLFHSGMRTQVARSLERLKREVRGITLIAGYPEYDGTRIFNSAIVIRDGARARQPPQGLPAQLPGVRRKALFHARHDPTWSISNGIKAGVLVCEDVWEPEPARQAKNAGAQVLLVINASPYEVDKQRSARRRWRERVSRDRAAAGVRQSDRRPGRAGVRRQFLRHECGRRGDIARAGVHRGPVPVDLEVDAAGRVTPVPGEVVPLHRRRRACTARWCRARATTSTSTVSPAW
jgi:hypothetical protein